MICCDSCPFSPTCEEEDDFYSQIFGAGDFEWGDDGYEWEPSAG